MNFTLNKKQQPMHLTKHGICTRERSQAGAEEYQVPIFENIASDMQKEILFHPLWMFKSNLFSFRLSSR